MDPFSSAFLAHAANDPQRPFLHVGDLTWTRGRVAEAAREREAALARAGWPQGSVVALTAGTGPEFLSAWLGCRLAGFCALQLDASGTNTEHRRAAERLGAAGLLDGAGELTQLGGTAIHTDLAAIKLTSGSTGEPSGVGVSADALLADARNLEVTMGLVAGDRFLASIPLSHSYGFSVLASPAMLLGAELVFAGAEDAMERAASLGATVLPSTPSWFAAELGRDSAPATSLRLLISAGAPLRAAVARAWREKRGLPIHAFYGSSECGGITFDRRGDGAERGTVGTPVEGVSVHIDAASGPGVVSVESGAVASRYLPEHRPERLGHGRFTTEDVAEFQGGELFLRGRTSEWINVKGKKVDPREVERVLEDLPGAEDVVVMGKSAEVGSPEVVRAVIACDEGALSFHDVTRWCRAKLAPHKVPRSVVFVRAIPRTERGKLDRRKLLAL